MKIVEWFTSNKYRKIHDFIFRFFVITVLGSGFLWFLTGFLLLPQIIAVLFVAYGVPNLLCHIIAFLRKKQNGTK